MKNIIRSSALTAIFVLGFFSSNLAQDSYPKTAQFNMDFQLPSYVNKVFSPDSLIGFDEQAAIESSSTGEFVGSEYKMRMYILKRRFINDKYGLYKATKPAYPGSIFQYEPKPVVQPACQNEDFEASTGGAITTTNQIAGWTVTRGTHNTPANSDACNLLGCCPLAPTESSLIVCPPGGFIDGFIGNTYPIFSIFGTNTNTNPAAASNNTHITLPMKGDNIIRIQSQVSNSSIERLSKTFSVTPQNAIFQFAFIGVLNSNHGCCEMGSLKINLSNANGILPCPTFSAGALSTACSNTNTGVTFYKTPYNGALATTNDAVMFNKWLVSSLDLSSYIGQNITIDVVASDCIYGGHFGYIYFDAQCGPMTIYGNNLPYFAGTGTVNVPTCGAAGATITAPPGLGPYSWASSTAFVPSNLGIPNYTNAVLISSVSAFYTLSMSPPGSCAPITRVVQSVITPAPALLISAVQGTCNSLTGVVTVTPSGSAVNPASLVWSPNPLSLNTLTTQGTYTLPIGAPLIVSVTTEDQIGCKITATMNLDPAPEQPTFAFTNSGPSQSVTCAVPVVTLNAVSNYSYNGTTLNYSWASNSNTFTGASSNITASQVGVYTVTALDPITLCAAIKTIQIWPNITPPVVSPLINANQNITCFTSNTLPVVVVATSPTVNIQHTIFSPLGSSVTSASGTWSYIPNSVGVSTVVTENLNNGCTTTNTFQVNSTVGFPTFNLISPQSFTLGCSTKSFAIINFTNASATGTDQVPNAGPVSFSIVSPGNVLPAYAVNPLSNISQYTISAAGQYTAVVNDNFNGCKTVLPFTVLDNKFGPLLDTLIIPQTILDCRTTSITLKAISSTPATGYVWSYDQPNGNLATSTIIVSTNTAAPTATLIDTYTLTMTDGNNKCITTSVVPIFQNTFRPITLITNGTANGTVGLTCERRSIQLVNGSSSTIPPSMGGPGNPVGFLWQGPSPQIELPSSSSYNASVPGVYTLTCMDDNNGCTSTGTLEVKDYSILPILGTLATATLDCGDTFAVLDANPLSSFSPTSALLYNWIRPESAAAVGSSSLKTFSVQNTGVYYVNVTDPNNGCLRTASVVVSNGTLDAAFEYNQTSTFAPSEVVFVNNSTSSKGNSGINTIWNFGNGKDLKTNSAGNSPVNVYTLPGTYKVKIYSQKGSCIDSADKFIQVELPSTFVIPNVFTPNGDGVNDFFFLKTASLESIDASIFDRWGRLVFKTEASTTGNISWDGKNASGKESPDGTYFYIIKAKGKDGKVYDEKGSLSLFR